MLFGRVEAIDADGTLVLMQEDRRVLVDVGASALRLPVAVGDFVALERDAASTWQVTRLGGPVAGAFDSDGDALRWRRPGQAPSRISRLWQRQAIMRALRNYLYEEGFLEIQAPLLVRGTCPDLHIDSFRADERYLVTSTEYQLKRLLVGGVQKLFSMTQNFRRGDEGTQHNPEFTMLEWARAFETLDVIEDDAEKLVRDALLAVQGETTLVFGDLRIDMAQPFKRTSVREALLEELGVVVDERFSLVSMVEGAKKAGIELPRSVEEDQQDVFSYLMLLLGPRLGIRVPTFLRDWPAFMTSSASVVASSPATAERSELYIAGIEIADGFPSLRDPGVQEAFFSRELGRRKAQGREVVALDERYQEALRQGIPPGAGMALGCDRLVMVLCKTLSIRDVLPFAWDEL